MTRQDRQRWANWVAWRLNHGECEGCMLCDDPPAKPEGA